MKADAKKHKKTGIHEPIFIESLIKSEICRNVRIVCEG